MIKLENIQTYCWEAAIRGMRNPFNSWDKSESGVSQNLPESYTYQNGETPILCPNDLTLMLKLIRGGTEHRKFLRSIIVTFDLTAPLYFWKEFDTYKVGTVRNSCSTMHTLHKEKNLANSCLDKFSLERIQSDFGKGIIFHLIEYIDDLISKYNETKDNKYWEEVIQLLPSSFNQKATITLNYEVCLNQFLQRRNHKLQEWRDYCRILACSLPYLREFLEEIIKEKELEKLEKIG